MEVHTVLANDVQAPVLAHIPHASTFIAADVRRFFLISVKTITVVQREISLGIGKVRWGVEDMPEQARLDVPGALYREIEKGV